MKTNFFENITAINQSAKEKWVIVIERPEIDKLLVSVHYTVGDCTDKAVKIIPPINFERNSPQEYDEQFFETLHALVPATNKLFCDIEKHKKQQDEARKQSTVQKPQVTKQETGKSEKEKKFDAQMKTVDELAAQKKYREAWMKVPDHKEFPEHIEKIRERKEQLSDQFETKLF